VATVRADPHTGRYPPPPVRVVEPGSPEHTAWMASGQAKRSVYEAARGAWGYEINLPANGRYVR
jgi:hypothetical protein